VKPLTKSGLRALHGWVNAHAMPEGLEIEDCCCGLLEICKHHSDRQQIYASQLPPETMARLLAEVESLRGQNKLMRDEVRRLRARVVM